MANVNASVEQILPQAGADNGGRRIGFLNAVVKAGATDVRCGRRKGAGRYAC